MTTFIYALSITLMIFLPVLLAIALRRRFSVPWWFFMLGVATFVASQVVHLPLNELLQDLGLLSEGMPPAGSALVQNAIILGLTAGLSEELARAVGYWFLFRRQEGNRREDGVMLGLGHGGVEAMTFGAVLTAAGITSLLLLRNVDLETLGLSAQQMLALTRQLELLESSPFMGILPLVERLLAISLHVFFSLVVWLAFKKRNALYVVLAVILHAAYDALIVYLAQQIENVWLLEGILFLLALPAIGVIWMLYHRRETTPAVHARPMLAELSLFGEVLRKELLYQWRTKRLLVVAAVFGLFGLLSPLIAQFTPELLRSIEGAEQFADLVPTPTAADAVGQYIKNITQFGFIIAVLLGMGAVAGEKERGTAAMVLSKPMPRWAFVLSKFAAQALVYLLGFVLAALGTYYYTLLLFEGLDPGPFLLGNGLLLLWLLVFAAVTMLGSALARSTGAAAALALAGAVVLLLAGSLPRIGAFAPSGLVSWASQLGLPAATPAPNAGALVASVVLILLSILGAIAAFEVEEL